MFSAALMAASISLSMFLPFLATIGTTGTPNISDNFSKFIFVPAASTSSIILTAITIGIFVSAI